ncbi:MAG: N-acetyl-alpha-D-glucosaminyl L-malate synthase BshA [Bacteroidia bacterium]
MNIGIVCYPTYGGSGVVATELGIALARKGHKVHFVSYSQPFRLNQFNENLFYHEVSVNDYPLFEYQPYESVLASKIVDVAIYERLDVLHVHYAIPHASVAYMAQQILISKKIYLPYITTLHGTDITLVGKDPSFEPIIRFSLNKSNLITAVSEDLMKDTLRNFKIDNKIEVIPNFINISDYNKENQPCNKKHYAPNNQKLLVHVSNFRKVKRVDDVIAVFNKVRSKVDCKLILVGDGPERPQIEQLARKSEFHTDILSLGRIPNPIDILCLGDVFILPSETESFGLAALEAMAMRMPVISTNSGGLPEVNLNNYSGFTSNVGDVDAMAKHCYDLFTDEVLYSKMSEQAYLQALKFDESAILSKYEDLYFKLHESGKKVSL